MTARMANWQFLLENVTGDEHKKLKINWKSLTKFF